MNFHKMVCFVHIPNSTGSPYGFHRHTHTGTKDTKGISHSVSVIAEFLAQGFLCKKTIWDPMGHSCGIPRDCRKKNS